MAELWGKTDRLTFVQSMELLDMRKVGNKISVDLKDATGIALNTVELVYIVLAYIVYSPISYFFNVPIPIFYI